MALFVVAIVALISKRSRVPAAEASSFSFMGSETQTLREQLSLAKGELELANAQLNRANQVMHFSTKYKIAADLAGDVFDIAIQQGIDPDLGFRLVSLESDFKSGAVSPVGAIGLTQVMPSTAKEMDKNMSRELLFDRRLNLKLGFRYLRGLITEQKGSVEMALLVYNRGPVAVDKARKAGTDPRNGYERIVMKGYKGKGTVD
ncbi:MAG: transglycosylase SLT domain-containing protein [Gemmatimonadaceae bacterium]